MRKKTWKVVLFVLLFGILTAAGIVFYLFNMPQRDVQASKTDFRLSSEQIVDEYLADAKQANKKYLQEEGDSKILAVTGTISSIDVDQNSQKVILLKGSSAKAGVSCTFTKETNAHTEGLEIGQTITVKGVIRSGAGFDEDLDLYEDVIMEKCDVINQK